MGRLTSRNGDCSPHIIENPLAYETMMGLSGGFRPMSAEYNISNDRRLCSSGVRVLIARGWQIC